MQTAVCGADSILPAVHTSAARSPDYLETAGTATMGKIKIISAGRIPEIIAPQRCSGCGRCIAACPKKLYAFELVNHRKHSINIAPESCSRCDRCILACPLEIISGETVTP